MKKTLIIVALAAVLVFAFATPAFAKYAGYSSSKQYVPWAEAQSLASLNPDAADMASGPHAGYATTTIKCAVCHSVHRGGSKLLNEGSSCAYCHTSVAHGGGAVASNLISWDVANLGPHGSRCANTDCHGGPHGVGASAYDGPASKLLTSMGDATLDELVAADVTAGGDGADLTTWNAETRALATAGVCQRSGCHSNSMMGVVTSGAETSRTIDVAGRMVTGHRVIADATTTWNADGSMGSSKTNLTIAFKPVDYCNSCHDLTDDNNGGKAAFPHAINDVISVAQGKPDTTTRPAVWLTAAPDALTQTTVVGPYNQYTASGLTIQTSNGSSIIDGVCLKCHRDGAGAGVGLSY